MAGSIAEFSPVPANNGMSPPVGAPEGGTALNALNDIMRNQNAAARSWFNEPLWRDVRDGTPTGAYAYDSGSVFRVNSINALPFYPVGKELKIVSSTWTRRGRVTASVISGSDTVVTCSLDAALTNVPFVVYSAAVELATLPGAPAFTAADQLMVSTAAGVVGTLDVPASRFVGRKAAGATVAMTAAEAIAVLGLGNVENKSSATIRGELTSGNVTAALGYTPLSTTGTAANSALLGGYPLSIGQGAYTVALRDASGYLLAQYFRSMHPVGTTPPSSIFVGSSADDGYLYRVTAASFISNLGLRTTANLTAVSQLTNDSGYLTGPTINRVKTNGISRGTYGSISVSGSDGGYAGIDFGDASVTWMSTRAGAGSHGIYADNSTWIYYFNNAGVLTVGTVPWANISSRPTALSQFTNDSAFITGINSGMVTAALGFTPYNNTNPSGFITAAALAWTNISGRPTALSQFTNDSAFITTAGRAYPRRSDGTAIDINWSGQSGQPTWLIGGNNGTDFYVYNPSNFSVSYATTAGSAGYATTAGSAPANGGNAATVGGYGVSVANTAGYGVVRDGSGIIYINDYYLASDRDLKTEIADIDGQAALAGIRAIGGKSYVKAGKAELGVIAQDVRDHFPQQVARGDDKTLSVGNLNGPIFAAIKELADAVERAGIAL